MRGGQAAPPAGFLPSHSISIAVSEPQKVRKYFFAKVVYQIRYTQSKLFLVTTRSRDRPLRFLPSNKARKLEATLTRAAARAPPPTTA